MKKYRVLNLGLVVGLLTPLVFIVGCATPSGEEGDITPMIIFLILIFGLMYFVLIRPQRKRQKEHEQLLSELKRGDKVITAGGIYGEIESVSEDSVVMRIESGTTMRVARNSVVLRRES